MKKFGLMLAAAGVAALFSIGAANAQGGASNQGVGDAAQKDKASTAGVGKSSGMRMKRVKRMRMRRM